jgi:hypothetical protein
MLSPWYFLRVESPLCYLWHIVEFACKDLAFLLSSQGSVWPIICGRVQFMFQFGLNFSVLNFLSILSDLPLTRENGTWAFLQNFNFRIIKLTKTPILEIDKWQMTLFVQLYITIIEELKYWRIEVLQTCSALSDSLVKGKTERIGGRFKTEKSSIELVKKFGVVSCLYSFSGHTGSEIK